MMTLVSNRSDASPSFALRSSSAKTFFFLRRSVCWLDLLAVIIERTLPDRHTHHVFFLFFSFSFFSLSFRPSREIRHPSPQHRRCRWMGVFIELIT